jgi:hypothetical protein
MTCQTLLKRLDHAEARLARVSAATGGHGVEVLWRDDAARYDPHAVPDALYVNRNDPNDRTLVYDVRRDKFVNIAWGAWLETQTAALRCAAAANEPNLINV